MRATNSYLIKSKFDVMPLFYISIFFFKAMEQFDTVGAFPGNLWFQ